MGGYFCACSSPPCRGLVPRGVLSEPKIARGYIEIRAGSETRPTSVCLGITSDVFCFFFPHLRRKSTLFIDPRRGGNDDAVLNLDNRVCHCKRSFAYGMDRVCCSSVQNVTSKLLFTPQNFQRQLQKL